MLSLPLAFSPLQAPDPTEQSGHPLLSEGCAPRPSPGLGVGADSAQNASSLSIWKAAQVVCGVWSYSGEFLSHWHLRGLEPDLVTACLLLSGELGPVVSGARRDIGTGPSRGASGPEPFPW